MISVQHFHLTFSGESAAVNITGGVCNSELTVMQELIEHKSHLTTQATVTAAKTVHIDVILPKGL